MSYSWLPHHLGRGDPRCRRAVRRTRRSSEPRWSPGGIENSGCVSGQGPRSGLRSSWNEAKGTAPRAGAIPTGRGARCGPSGRRCSGEAATFPPDRAPSPGRLACLDMARPSPAQPGALRPARASRAPIAPVDTLASQTTRAGRRFYAELATSGPGHRARPGDRIAGRLQRRSRPSHGGHRLLRLRCLYGLGAR